MSRPSLFSEPTPAIIGTLSSRVLRSKRAFAKCFAPGTYHTLCAVTYVANLSLVAELFDIFQFEAVELVIGEEAAPLRGSAEGRVALVERLYRLRDTGRLRLFLSPKRSLHTKLYLLYGTEQSRIITSSANFTRSGWRGRQVNHASIYDIPKGLPSDPISTNRSEPTLLSEYDSYVQSIERDYLEHRDDFCEGLFFGPLHELMNRSSLDTTTAVRIWLQQDEASAELAITDSMDTLARELTVVTVQEVEGLGYATTMPLAPETSPSDSKEPNTSPVASYITLSLPAGSRRQKAVAKALKPFDAKSTGHEVRVPTTTLLDHRRHVVPLMNTGLSHSADNIPIPFAWIGLQGQQQSRCLIPNTEADSDARRVTLQKAIAPVRRFLELADTGRTSNLDSVRSAIVETLVYLFCAPFFHLNWAHECQTAASRPQRGPRSLFLFGDSENGKSTVLHFGLSLLAGRPVDPVPGRDLSADGVLAAGQLGTAFPVVFDDVPHNRFRRGMGLEKVIKGYWLRSEAVGRSYPALVLSSNRVQIPRWMESRMKRITFPVRYARSDMKVAREIRDLTGTPGRLFMLFAGRYLQHLAAHPIGIQEDECALGRTVLRSIWEDADHSPEEIPATPHEVRYPPGRPVWQRILRGEGHAAVQLGHKRSLQVIFEHYKQAQENASLLPSALGATVSNRMVVIDDGRRFLSWVYPEGNMPLRYSYLRTRLYLR
ncbi:MAG: phospholipase D family protein [Longimonas sp.]|uniref:phospholipase D family protein n=1 Tax=Longimonas sp. TaxID=2039626 RepID=UPI0033525F87